jgi:hypothetical protein
MRKRQIRLFTASMIVILASGCAELQKLDLEGILAAGAPVDQATVSSGLRQALDVGVERTVSMLSSPGGFSNDPAIRLTLPKQLDPLAKTLRTVGFSEQVDSLEVTMNVAAEAAAKKALPIFTSAIQSMSIGDAFAILNGPDDAATSYFRDHTSDELRHEFVPVVATAMQEVGFWAIYQELIAQYERIPFVQLPSLDLVEYVTNGTLAALYGQLAVEEARIREDPAARSTALLRRVFGAETQSTP